MSPPKWYSVTFRGTAEMVVWVLADTPDEARMRAEDVQYEDQTEVEFVKGKAYTMKVRRDPTYAPPERYQS
jgi:hypothetical protein